MSTQLQLLIAVPMVLTAVSGIAGALIRARKSSKSRTTPFPLSRIGCHGRKAMISPWNRGRRPLTSKPGTLRLAVTAPLYLIVTFALATTTRAELIWGNMKYNPGTSGMSGRKYEGAYEFSVQTILKQGVVSQLQITEVNGPYAPNKGDFVNIPIPASEVSGNTIAVDLVSDVQEYHPPAVQGGRPRKGGKDTFENLLYSPGSLSFTVIRKGSVKGTSWSFTSTPCVNMPEPPTNILFVIGTAGTIAYGWRRRREQRRQRPVGPPESIE
jgi:hypothetical protein